MVFTEANKDFIKLQLVLADMVPDVVCGEQIKEAERRFRLIFESANDAMFIMHRDKFLDCNAKAMELYGGDLGYIIDNTPYNCSPVYQPDGSLSKDKALEKINAAIDGQPQFFEWQHMKKDGNLFYAEISLTCIEPEKKRPVVLSIVRDITQRKLYEAMLMQYREQLEELVNERTKELKRANELLRKEVKEKKLAERKVKKLLQQERESSNRLVEEMDRRIYYARGWVHELKTPITSLLGCSELLLNRTSDAMCKKLASQIYTSSKELNKRTGELYDLVKGEVGALRINPSNFDIYSVIEGIVDSLSSEAKQRGLELKLETQNDTLEIYADKERVKQVILNILDNSFKYCQENASITIKTSVTETDFIVSIADTGIGISEDRLKDIFVTPYIRGNRLSPYINGLGMGLALCKNIIDLHNGKIWIESQEGEGCEVSFSIPLKIDTGEKN